MSRTPVRKRAAWSVGLCVVVGLYGFARVGAAESDQRSGRNAAQDARTDRGRIVVLASDLPVGGDGLAEGIASVPEHLAAVLREAGFDVTLIDCRSFSDQGILDRRHFDLLILPYGPSFPVAAADNLRRFLRAGGKFISVGGYAFDHLLTRTERGWQAYKPKPPEGPQDVRWRFDVPADEVRPHGLLTFSGWMRTHRVLGQHFAFMTIYQYDANGKLLEFKDVAQVTGTTPWRQYTHRFRVNHLAARVTLYAGMWVCAGQAWFDQIKLTDAGGKVLVDAAVVPGADVDTLRPRHWYRPDKTLCTINSSVRHGGQASLQARLNYAHREERVNTRRGKPGDGLVIEPTQIGVFDPDYRIRRARTVRAAPDQHIFDEGWSIDSSSGVRPIRGYAASGMLGTNAARWRTLVNTYDTYGRLRGAAGAIMHHYAGTWKGSSWAFFGLTSHDVFAPGRPGGDVTLVRLADHLIRDVYLVSALGDKACYRQGERARATVTVYNGGRQRADVTVRTSILAEGQATPVYQQTDTTAVEPGARGQVTVEWSPGRYHHDFYRIRAELSLSSAPQDRIDVIEGGFVVRDDRVLAAGPKLTVRDNYLHVDGRGIFMFGTDDWSYVFNAARETPLQWRRDMEKRRDFGVTIYENLQVGLPASPAAQVRFFNQVQGLVQLSQRFRQVYFPCLLCGYDIAVDDATLRKHADFAGAFAKQFANIPGLIYYLNGDLRCRITEAVQPQLNQFIRGRYASDKDLQAAWGAADLRIGQLPAEEYPETNAPWADVRAYDVNLFRAHLIRRWHDAPIDAIRRHDTVHPTTSEFYSLPSAGVDVPAAIGRLDLSNIGYFNEPIEDIRRFPSVVKYSDLRSRGKPFGPGEYGVKTHPAWSVPAAYGYHKARTRAQAIDLFLAVAHYTLGLGGSRIHNWCWKDSSHAVFPWGMVYPCDEVEKDTAYVHRNQSLLFRHFRCVYEPPSVYVMTPDTHRLGGRKRTVIEGILNGIQLVLACHVDSLGMLNEHALTTVPAAAKVIFLPIPFCLTDAAYMQLLGFVRRGGTLYASGDVSFDPLRRRTRVQRLTELCGVQFVKQRYAGIDFAKAPAEALRPTDPNWPTIPGARACIDVEPAGAKPLWRSADGRPVVFEHRVGRGRTVFSTDPIELRTERATIAAYVALYRHVLDLAQVHPAVVKPNNPYIHVMRVPLQDGGRVMVFFNADETAPHRTITHGEGDAAVTLTIRRQRPALLWLGKDNHLRAAEVQGELRIGGRVRLADDTEGIVLSLDGRDLGESTALVLMPLRPGRVTLATRARWQDAVVEVGEVRRGRWNGFERRAPRQTPGRVSVDVGHEQVYSVLLVCNRSQLPRWRDAMRQVMLKPVAAR